MILENWPLLARPRRNNWFAVGQAPGGEQGGARKRAPLIHPERRDHKYNSSTFALAQGVRRKNFKLDLMLGSWVKQRIGTAAAIASHPMLSESCVTIISSVMPSSVGRPAGFLLVSMSGFYR